MPRYEFSEGSSNKFWEIKLTGKSFTTTYGKIGTSGQTSLKEWDSADKAKKEYEKLIAEKTKKGYELVDGEGGDEDEDEDEDEEEEEEDEEEEEAPAPKKKAAAKAAPAKAAAKAPAKAAAPAKKAASNGGTAPRYFEFSEGTSNKFWEITMTGTAVRTRYGKIGTDGQNTLKEFPTADAAQKEYDKLVREKTKKGYEEK